MSFWEKSPLQIYCEEIDKKYSDKNYGWYYLNLALKLDPKYFTNLLLKDWKWRADHQQNILASIEGTQGSFKSLFGLSAGIHLTRFFGVPFNFKTGLNVDPDDLDYNVRHGKNRETFIYDEQPQKSVGIGSKTTQISLKDYEEIGRYTQKNILYCSPEVYDHAHYFVFTQYTSDMYRIKNEKCLKCDKYSECQASFYKTLCDIPFHERDGYPLKGGFILLTKRLMDKIFMPRGIVEFPMVTPNTALLYNKFKQKNIKKFEKGQTNAWKHRMDDLEKFLKEKKSELMFFDDVKEKWKLETKAVFKSVFYSYFGNRKFTTEEAEILIGTAYSKIRKKADAYNRKGLIRKA